MLIIWFQLEPPSTMLELQGGSGGTEMKQQLTFDSKLY